METMKKFLAGVLLFSIMITLASVSFGNDRIYEAFRKSYIKEHEGNYIAALNELKTVYDQESYEINLRMGWLSYLAGSQMESKRYYERAIKLKPFSIEPKIGITYPESFMGNWDAVINQYKAILEIAPSNTIILYNLGLIHYNHSRYNEAEILFKKLVNLYPFDYDGLLMLGWTNFQQKKFREAKVLFQKALLNTPTSESAQEGLKLLQ
jgi:tetratricopeptide (TPR) repeat protein